MSILTFKKPEPINIQNKPVMIIRFFKTVVNYFSFKLHLEPGDEITVLSSELAVLTLFPVFTLS